MKIRVLTQNPLSVWFWGLELQAAKYIEGIRKIDSSIDINYFSWEEEWFDILHVIGIHGGVSPYWINAWKKKGIKIIISPVFYIKPIHLFDFRRPIIYKSFSYIPHHVVGWMKTLLQSADLILPNSQAEAEQIISIFWIQRKNIRVLHNGVDEDYFDWINANLFKEEYKLNSYILSVSHIEPRKNHEILINTFLKANQSWVIPQHTKLVLIGEFRWNYQSHHKKIKTLLQNNKSKIIHVTGLKNSDPLFRSAYLWANAHILLSTLETPGLSNLEALLAWLPLILWDCEPIREYFWDYAVYLQPKNERAIWSAILWVVDRKSQSVEAQISFAKLNYSWNRIAQKLYMYYKI